MTSMTPLYLIHLAMVAMVYILLILSVWEMDRAKMPAWRLALRILGLCTFAMCLAIALIYLAGGAS